MELTHINIPNIPHIPTINADRTLYGPAIGSMSPIHISGKMTVAVL